MWARGGTELFYADRPGGSLIAAEVETDSVFRVLNHTTLFTLGSELGVVAGFNVYDIGPNDERFLMVRVAGPSGASGGDSRFILLQNWFEELRQRMGTN